MLSEMPPFEPTNRAPEIEYTLVGSPLGEILVAARAEKLIRVVFQSGTHPEPIAKDWRRNDRALAPVRRQLDLYFAGRLRAFEVELGFSGTPFQESVWRALCGVPYGELASYADIARVIGSPKAVRAVGAANGANPIGIIVPCHRVIGKNGKLVGYTGGLSFKEALIRLEKVHNMSWVRPKRLRPNLARMVAHVRGTSLAPLGL